MDVKLTINHLPEEEDIQNGEMTINKRSKYDELPLSVALDLIKSCGNEADEKLEITVKVK